MDKTEPKDLGAVRHETVSRGDMSLVKKGVEDARAKRKIEADRYEEEVLENKRKVAKKIKDLEEQIAQAKRDHVETERKSKETHDANMVDVESEIEQANELLKQAVGDDLASARKKAEKVAADLGYQTVNFHGQTEESWQFALTDLKSPDKE